MVPIKILSELGLASDSGGLIQKMRRFSLAGAFLLNKSVGFGFFFVTLQLTILVFSDMSTGNMIRFACILLLWVALCYILLTRAARIDFNVVFTIVASGIIVFVPLYKKYVRKKD